MLNKILVDYFQQKLWGNLFFSGKVSSNSFLTESSTAEFNDHPGILGSFNRFNSFKVKTSFAFQKIAKFGSANSKK